MNIDMDSLDKILKVGGDAVPFIGGFVYWLIRKEVKPFSDRITANERGLLETNRNVNAVKEQVQAMREELPKQYFSKDDFEEHKADMNRQFGEVRTDVRGINSAINGIYQLLAKGRR